MLSNEYAGNYVAMHIQSMSSGVRKHIWDTVLHNNAGNTYMCLLANVM